MLVVVLVTFTLCWGPPTILDAFTSLQYTLFAITLRVIPPDVTFTLTTIAYCNSFFNPLIYLCMSRYASGHLLQVLLGVHSGASSTIVSVVQLVHCRTKMQPMLFSYMRTVHFVGLCKS